MLYTARVLNSPFGKYEEKRPPPPPEFKPEQQYASKTPKARERRVRYLRTDPGLTKVA